MKSIVRAFVLTLVATGAFASMHTNTGVATSMTPMMSAQPVPTCPPNDPKACGTCDFGGCMKGK